MAKKNRDEQVLSLRQWGALRGWAYPQDPISDMSEILARLEKETPRFVDKVFGQQWPASHAIYRQIVLNKLDEVRRDLESRGAKKRERGGQEQRVVKELVAKVLSFSPPWTAKEAHEELSRFHSVDFKTFEKHFYGARKGRELEPAPNS